MRLCSYYFLMVHSSLLLPRSALQSKLLDISSPPPPFVVHFVAPFIFCLVGRWLSRSHKGVENFDRFAGRSRMIHVEIECVLFDLATVFTAALT